MRVPDARRKIVYCDAGHCGDRYRPWRGGAVECRPMRRVLSGCSVLTAEAAATLAGAPTLPQSASKPDSPQILRRVDALKKTAGAEWGEAMDVIGAVDPSPRHSSRRSRDRTHARLRQPRGGQPDGYCRLDRHHVDRPRAHRCQVRGPARLGAERLKTLGLDPARVTHVIAGHGHGDHVGGASYCSRRRGARRRAGSSAGSRAERRYRRHRWSGMIVDDVTFRFTSDAHPRRWAAAVHRGRSIIGR